MRKVRIGRPWTAGIVVLLVALLVGAFVAWKLSHSDAPARLIGYHPGDDERVVVVVAETGLGETITHAEVVRETPGVVQVEVMVHQAKGSWPALAVRREATLRLRDPLGDRQVLAPDGRALPRLNDDD